MGVHRGPCCLPRSPGGKDPSRPLTLRTSTKGPSDTNHADIPQLAAKGGRDQATCDSCAERRLSVLFTLLLLGLPDPLYLSQIPYEDGPCEKARGLQHSWEKRSPAPSTTPRPGGVTGIKTFQQRGHTSTWPRTFPGHLRVTAIPRHLCPQSSPRKPHEGVGGAQGATPCPMLTLVPATFILWVLPGRASAGLGSTPAPRMASPKTGCPTL